MAIQVSKNLVVNSKFDIVKIQYLLHCHFNRIKLSGAELDTLTTVALVGGTERAVDRIVQDGTFSSEQSVRNCFSKLTKLGLLSYEHGKRQVNPNIKIGISDAVLLDLKILYKNEPKKAEGVVSNISATAKYVSGSSGVDV